MVHAACAPIGGDARLAGAERRSRSVRRNAGPGGSRPRLRAADIWVDRAACSPFVSSLARGEYGHRAALVAERPDQQEAAATPGVTVPVFTRIAARGLWQSRSRERRDLGGSAASAPAMACLSWSCRPVRTRYGRGRPLLGRPRLSGRYRVIAMAMGKLPTLIALSAVLAAVRIGVTVPELELTT